MDPPQGPDRGDVNQAGKTVAPLAAGRGRAARRVDPVRAVAIALAGAIALLVVPGAIDGFGIATLPAFDFGTELDSGFSFPTAYAVALLAVAGVVAGFCAGSVPDTRGRWAWAVTSLTMLGASATELLALHEQLEPEFATSAAQVVLWGLLIAFAGLVWLAITASIWSIRRARDLWLAGGAAWIAALALDEVPDLPGGRSSEKVIDGLEEVMELAGTSLLVLAMVAALEYWRRRPAAR